MIRLIRAPIKHPIAVTGLTGAAKQQKVLGSAFSLTVVATVSLKLFPTFLTDRIIGFLGDIHRLSFHELIFTPKVDQGLFIVEPE